MLRPVHVALSTSLCDLARASGAAAVVTLTKRAGYTWILGSVCWDYAASPTSGSLIIAANGSSVFKQSITAAGPGVAPWMNPRSLPSITDGLTYTITLADGSATKDLNVEAWEMPTDQT